jgi:hypothetical protein
MADGGGVALRHLREINRRPKPRVRETPPPTRFAGHLLPQEEEDRARDLPLDERRGVGIAAGETFVLAYNSPHAGNLFTTLTAIPEPTTWTLMIAGFGAVGAMLRTQRRRRNAALAGA